MTSILQTLHEEHKQRIARIDASAYVPTPEPPPPAIVSAKKEEGGQDRSEERRREYEKSIRVVMNNCVGYRIKNAVAAEFNITVADLIGRSQKPKFAIPRFIAVGFFAELTRMSLPAIGRQLGGRDHTTIMHARRRAAELFADEEYIERVKRIRAEVSR